MLRHFIGVLLATRRCAEVHPPELCCAILVRQIRLVLAARLSRRRATTAHFDANIQIRDCPVRFFLRQIRLVLAPRSCRCRATGCDGFSSTWPLPILPRHAKSKSQKPSSSEPARRSRPTFRRRIRSNRATAVAVGRPVWLLSDSRLGYSSTPGNVFGRFRDGRFEFGAIHRAAGADSH